MPRSSDLAIFVLTTDRRQTTDKTDHITPCACARGNNMIAWHSFIEDIPWDIPSLPWYQHEGYNTWAGSCACVGILMRDSPRDFP